MPSQIECYSLLHKAYLLFQIPLTRYLSSTYSVPQTMPSPRNTVWKIIVYVSLELEVKLADKKMSFDSGMRTAQAFPMSAFYLLRVFNQAHFFLWGKSFQKDNGEK